jgi:trimeric autotransporter adhesin
MKRTVRFRTHLSTSLLLILGYICPFNSFAQPANDACGSAQTIVSGTSCTTTPGSLRIALGSSTATAGINAFCGNAASPDVWYSFVAQSTLPTIRLSGMATRMDDAPRLQIFNTTSCVAATLNANSNNCASGTNVTTLNLVPATALTIGTTYLVRVFTNGNSVAAGVAADWNFNICIIDAPANDLCGGSTLLTSSTSCVNTTGNFYAATLTATTITAPDCASAATRDVWYRFVAQTTNPTITLSNIGVNFTNPGIQLLSNNCGGTFTSFYCGTTSIAADHLTPGTTYFIRVYSTSAIGPVSPAGAGFDICVTDPVSPAPSNDECAGAINLPVFNSCSNNPGNMAGSTASATPLGGTCTGPLGYDVWYKFIANSTSTTITLGGIGTNFVSPNIEILSGTCGALTSISCGTSPRTAAGLTIGNTYYVRIYSTSLTPPNGNARFTICATTTGLPVRFGNSYVNITRKTTGGVVQTGDVLEIRMTINHTSGTMYGLRYVDNIPTNTTIATAPADAPIKIITNEGLTYKSYSQAAGDDAATYKASPPVGEYNIRMNLGFGAFGPGVPPDNTATETVSAVGRMINTNNPRGGGGLLFATAFRVVVTGLPGDTITLNPGQFIYQTSIGGPDVTLTATPFKIVISDPLTLCANSIGVNNAAEFGGTFGSGNTQNRTTDLAAPITGYTFINDVNAYNNVGDGRYGIVKNISPRSGTNRNARQIPNCGTGLAPTDPLHCNNKMFNGHWYVDGDHTGTNNAIGNIPPAKNDNSGYMLLVNADYVASEIYRQTLTNLCPNTYYEFSAWVRNVCTTCGVDSVGAQFAGTVTSPANGYPGVYPNLAFLLNDVDYYNTGDIDTLGWLKRGFVFRTGPTQTTATFSIRNNSQGGGGNDWALDDIAVATCLPNMQYSPSNSPTICEGNSIIITDTISSYFNNYTFYKWQRSTDGGATWVDIGGASGTGSPVYNGVSYVYVTTYTIPPAFTTAANDGDRYRVVVGTTAANLTDANCQSSDPVTINLDVLTDCGPLLDVDLLSVSGQLVSGKAKISWSTSKENEPVSFSVEKSNNGTQFTQAGSITGQNNPTAETNYYVFNDPVSLSDKAWYRIKMITATQSKYSRIISLNKDQQEFALGTVLNPFASELLFDVYAPSDAKIDVIITDLSGRMLKKKSMLVKAGTNSLSMNQTESLAAGIYILQVWNNDKVLTKMVMKK